MFIDASREFKTGKSQNELTDKNIERIIETYVQRKDIPKYAHVADMEEIVVKNGYNLNIPRYVDMSEEEETIDIIQVKSDIADVTVREQDAMEKVFYTMKMLGL